MTNRRQFLKRSALGAGALAAPAILPSGLLGQESPSNRVNLALIGCGGRMRGLGLGGFAKLGGARIIAAVDPFRSRREDFASRLDVQYGGKYCTAVEDYRTVLERDDIDGVVVATPDHWHGPVAIAAARAGKDMYVEKPLTISLDLAKVLRKELAKNKCVFQYGTQQRSGQAARTAMELVWNGHVGEVKQVDVGSPHLGADSRTKPGEQPVPEGFNYDLWLGPAPVKPYFDKRCTNFGAWHCYDYALGFVAGWGAHPLDILQWGLQTDDTCPVEFEGTGFIPEDDFANTLRTWDVRFKYAGGLPGRFLDSTTAKGVIGKYHPRMRGNDTVFHGTEGWVAYARGVCYLFKGGDYVNTATVDLSGAKKKAYVSNSQHGNFVDCMKSRKPTINPIESAIRSDTISHLTNIAVRTGRKVKFDPEKEEIAGDAAANAMLSRPMRTGYEVS
jgi:predicted dehydrogenase